MRYLTIMSLSLGILGILLAGLWRITRLLRTIAVEVPEELRRVKTAVSELGGDLRVMKDDMSTAKTDIAVLKATRQRP